MLIKKNTTFFKRVLIEIVGKDKTKLSNYQIKIKKIYIFLIIFLKYRHNSVVKC